MYVCERERERGNPFGLIVFIVYPVTWDIRRLRDWLGPGWKESSVSGFTFVFFPRESKLWLVQKTRSTYFEYNKWECVSGRRWYSSVDTKWGGALCSGKSKSAHIFSGFCMTCLYVNLKNTAGLHKTFKCRQFPLLLTTVDGSSSIHKLWGWTMCSSKTSDLKLSYNVSVSLLEQITIIRWVGCELVV